MDLWDWIRVGGCLRVRPGLREWESVGSAFHLVRPSSTDCDRHSRYTGVSQASPTPSTGGTVPSSRPPSFPSPSPALSRRKLAAEEALYLTANNRTIFHVTALARLATSTRRVCLPPPSLLAFATRQKGIEDGKRLSWHSSWITDAVSSKSHQSCGLWVKESIWQVLQHLWMISIYQIMDTEGRC